MPAPGVLERLLRAGAPGGPTVEEALGIFADLRVTPDEGRAIDLLLARETRDPLPEPLLVALASALVDRGQSESAVRALARADSCAALVIRADLLAARGDLVSAMALVERALLRDIDWPGARERHARWRAALGQAPPRKVDTTATMVTSRPQAPFRLLREIGRGGAGTVYEAEDPDLGRHVALKVYHRVDRDRAQLLHEARVAVALAGKGVVRVFDVDPEHGWLVMEWARSGALHDLLRSGDERTRSELEGWAVPLADALARVHAAGWIHNDVKPANVLLRDRRTPLLSDFGGAKRAGEPSPPGSVGYVSPERLAGRSSDPRDDVFAFGRVLQCALDAVGEGGDLGRWRRIAASCTGPDPARPAHAVALASLVRKSST
ncbi:MAG: protein kinase domain-containing protein [Polyangiaceae bacterium]|jgi:eukaryotic-like serine/threonine-protein kinase